MKNKLRKIFIGGFLVLFAVLASGEAQSLANSKEHKPKDASEMVQSIRSRVPTERVESQGILKVRAPKTKTRMIPIRFSVVPISQDSWESIYETLPPVSEELLQKLTIRSHVAKPNEYFLSVRKNTDDEWVTKQLSPGKDTAIGFGGTDFWLCDLGLEFLHWPKQELLKREMRKGRSCRVLQSIPKKVDGNMYSRVVSWVDNESDGIVMAQSFNEANERIKEFEIQSFKKVEGVWQLKQMTIYDNKSDSRTTLEIDLQVGVK